MTGTRRSPLLVAALKLAIPAGSVSPGQFVQVHQDFSRDPGRDHDQNRTAGTEMPAVIRDFGWPFQEGASR